MDNRIKVGFLITKGDIGGAQKYVCDLVENLNKEKFKPLILTGREGKKIKADYYCRWLSNSFKPYFLFINDWLALAELFFIFKKEKLDVIHLNSSKAGVIGAIAGKLAGVKKIIFTAHGWVFSDETLPKWRRNFYIRLHKLAVRFQDKIICVSEYDKNLALKYKIVPEEKLITIWNGINLKKFQQDLLIREEARKDFYKNQESRIKNQEKKLEEIWVGSIGRLVKEKNYGLLIEAINKLKVKSYKVDKVKFFIIGEGAERGELELKIKNYGLEKDIFIVEPTHSTSSGYNGDDAKLLKAFDLFVLPSKKEGMPYTLIEAMVAGVPVLTSDAGGMPEIVGKDRGWLFKSGYVDELIQRIGDILDNGEERNKRMRAAKEFAEKNFDLEEKVRRLEKIYKE